MGGGGRRRTPTRKKSAVPKVKLDPTKRKECPIAGEGLETVLASMIQLATAVLPVGMSVRFGDNREEVRKYVVAYVAAVRPHLVELLGEDAAGAGIKESDPRWEQFKELAKATRAEVHKIMLYPVGLKALMAEDVRVSDAALGVLRSVGVIVDDR